ncbi:hypothetical protein ON010_g18048 [Phytophthora cinnamomi]|nr:hypothetical protein ON010_g18048 [Phytophthora cinnamomi]
MHGALNAQLYYSDSKRYSHVALDRLGRCSPFLAVNRSQQPDQSTGQERRTSTSCCCRRSSDGDGPQGRHAGDRRGPRLEQAGGDVPGLPGCDAGTGVLAADRLHLGDD